MRKFLLSVLISLLTAVTATAGDYDFTAETPEGATLAYIINSDGETVTITKSPGTEFYYEGALNIPNQVTDPNTGETYTVTTIGEGAFNGWLYITALTIPNTVTKIECRGFANSGMLSVEIPESVTTIGMYAFENCQNLSSVDVPESVTDLGIYAFTY